MKASQAKLDRLKGMAGVVENYRTQGLDGLPDADSVHEILDGVLSTRDGKLLRSAPKRHDKPLANVFWRVLNWHRSNGWLGTVYMALWDCNDIAKTRDLDITGNELKDQLDTLAMVLTRGASRAVDNWQAALTSRRRTTP